MSDTNLQERRQHNLRSVRLVCETLAIFALLAGLIFLFYTREDIGSKVFTGLLMFLMGCWMHRLYTNAHEAIHKKLFPDHLRLNDLVGQLLLLPLLIPLPVYRKIHAFHHGHNRRDHATSTLDGYVVDQKPGPLKKAWIYMMWYLGVFAGGYFLHGLISVVLFLLLPRAIAVRVSPAFKGWGPMDQVRSWLAFSLGIALHMAVGWTLGTDAWVAILGIPMLCFAWVYSLIVYIYHYRTSYGDEVRYNVRSVDAPRIFSWWLLNFNRHAAHHRLPKTPWYALPAKDEPLPEKYRDNNNVQSVSGAILQQWKGPSIFEKTP